ncbi:MAG: DUF6514 family protein [Oscillospiraceae bacterium]
MKVGLSMGTGMGTVVERSTQKDRFVYTLYLKYDFNVEMYGISVLDLKKKKEMSINSITTVERQGKIFYNVIKDNLVYPEHLKDVIYELIVKSTEV